VLTIASPVYQCNAPLARLPPQPGQGLALLLELSTIPALELVETLRTVTEPASQLITGGQLLAPLIQPRVRLAHTARPQPIDEHPVAIGSRGLLASILETSVDRQSTMIVA
jgi:hypothetical protein